MAIDEAQKTGAMMLFGKRTRCACSTGLRELCGGTHVARTGEIGLSRPL
jgi:alanyl-tRNA synthetase